MDSRYRYRYQSEHLSSHFICKDEDAETEPVIKYPGCEAGGQKYLERLEQQQREDAANHACSIDVPVAGMQMAEEAKGPYSSTVSVEGECDRTEQT